MYDFDKIALATLDGPEAARKGPTVRPSSVPVRTPSPEQERALRPAREPVRDNNWTPVLSIVTPTFNSMRYFKETAASVLQVELPYEWIIVDDCSSDGTVEYLQSIARSNDHVVLLLNDTCVGKPRVNYSRGLNAARGRYVLFLDHDDTIASADALARAVDQMRTSDASRVSLMKVAYMDAASRVYKVKAIPCANYNAKLSGKRLLWTVLLSPTYPLKQGAVVIDKTLFDEVGHVFDIEFILAASHRTDFMLVDDVGLNYRNMRSSLSSGVAIRLKDREGFWMRLIDTYVPNSRFGIKQFFKSYKWTLGWAKLVYSCVTSKRI